MMNRMLIPAVAALVLLALFVTPVHADAVDDLRQEVAEMFVHVSKYVEQKRPVIVYSVDDVIAEGDYWKGECEKYGDLYDKRINVLYNELSERSHEGQDPAPQFDFFRGSLKERRAFIEGLSIGKKDEAAKSYKNKMKFTCGRATEFYNKALSMMYADEFSQRAKVYDKAAGVYDQIGNATAAEDARDEAEFARGRQVLASDSDCLIVTATFGSPMAIEVQLVRDFRDNTIKQEYLGSRYVTALNAIYYSFSPYVADSIDQNPSVKPFMRLILAPLIAIVLLSQGLYSFLAFSPEIATIAFILFGGALVGLVYIMPVMLSAFWLAARKQWQVPPVSSLKPLVVMWAGLLAALVIGAVLRIDIIAVLSSGLLFACTVFLIAGAAALYITGYLGIVSEVRNE